METSVIGRGLLLDVAPALEGSKKALLIAPTALAATAEKLKEVLQDSGVEVLLAEVPSGEDAKRVEVASFCWKIMGQADFNRMIVLLDWVEVPPLIWLGLWARIGCAE